MPSGSLVPSSESWDGELSNVLIVQGEMISDLLCQFDAHKSAAPVGMHMRAMRELMKELTSPLPVIYQQSWLIGQARHLRINL